MTAVTTSPAATDATASTDPTTGSDTWALLLRRSAAAVVVIALAMQSAGRFVGPSLIVLAVVSVTGAAALPRRRRTGALLVGIVNLLGLLLHAPPVVISVIHPEALLASVLNVGGAVASILSVVAAVAILRRADRASGAPRRLVGGAVVVMGLFAVIAVAGYATRASAQPTSGEAVVVHSGLAVSPSSVVVEADAPTLVIRNTDPLYVRSFDIDALDLHVFLPPRTSVRVELPPHPATYDFFDFVTLTPATSGTIEVR